MNGYSILVHGSGNMTNTKDGSLQMVRLVYGFMASLVQASQFFPQL